MTFEQIQRNAIAECKALENNEVSNIYIGTSTCGHSSGASKVLDHINVELKRGNIAARVIEVGCIGFCYLEPLIYIAKHGRPRVCYGSVTPDIASQLITDYIVNNNPRPDLALCTIGKGEIAEIPKISDLPMFKSQVRIALRNCGYIDPGNINDYVSVSGYTGLVRALNISPGEVIEGVGKSGLRGRGGAGFHTGTKWRLCYDAPGTEKYLVCNAAEGDPAAFANRTLLEGDPHSVLEGMIIGAYAVGATQGYIYINDEYQLAISRVRAALKQAEELGFLGNNILDSNYGLNIEVKEGTGDFICGEETALIRFLEGKRSVPYSRPPFPAISGLRDKPTVVNNVETLADVSAILQKSADWYASYGTEKSKGTKIFTISGKITRTGIVEIPMGITLRQIINDIGGGIPNGKEFKAVRIGGPTGGFLSANAFDTPIEYEQLTVNGAIMGSGSIAVADSNICIVNLVKDCLSFTHAESCGQCVLCREGTMQMLEILMDITDGRGKPEYVDLLLELGEGLKLGALCALGRTAPNPVLTTIRDFRDEYVSHINRKRCPALVCKRLILFHIYPDKCQGCLICLKNCPADAIAGGEKMIHVINQNKCIRCGICLDVCPPQFAAVAKVSGKQPIAPKEPIPVESWGKI